MTTERTTHLAYDDAALVLADGTRIPVTSGMIIESDIERVRTNRAAKPDERWSFTDPAGHTHTYVRDDEDVPRLPSLERRTRMAPCPGGCDDPECEGMPVEEWFCRECGALVEPGFTPDYNARDIGIPLYETISYSLTAEFPAPKGKRSWRHPRTRTITMRATDPPLVGPIEGAEYQWNETEKDLHCYPLPTLHAGNIDFAQASAGDKLVLSVQLYGEEMRDVKRKPTGP